MEKLTIWTLNATTQLLEKEQREEIINDCKKLGYDAEFGNRNKFNSSGCKRSEVFREQADNESDKEYNERYDLEQSNLMPDIEYYVPIVPKCIGDLFEQDQDNELLQNIREYYEKEALQDPYEEFWEEKKYIGSIRKYKMLTTKCKGYYSLLKETKPNILIGYSQGGLVARYLQWLDKNVFKDDAIKGIIAVSAPIFGSPLANPINRGGIIAGIVKIIKLAGFDLLYLYYTTFKKEEENAKELANEWVNTFFNGCCNVFFDAEFLLETALEIVNKFPNLIELEQFLGMVGGVMGNSNNACYDFNITKMEDSPLYSINASKYAVISSINNTEENVTNAYGIISADTNLLTIIDSISNSLFQLLELFFNSMSEKQLRASSSEKQLRTFSMDVCQELKPSITELAEWQSSKLLYETKSEGLKSTELPKSLDIFNNDIMHEYQVDDLTNETIKRVINSYNKGDEAFNIPAKANDFIIPSAYQIMLNINPKNNYVNTKANHISGSDINEEGGKINYKKIREYLKTILESDQSKDELIIFENKNLYGGGWLAVQNNIIAYIGSEGKATKPVILGLYDVQKRKTIYQKDFILENPVIMIPKNSPELLFCVDGYITSLNLNTFKQKKLVPEGPFYISNNSQPLLGVIDQNLGKLNLYRYNSIDMPVLEKTLSTVFSTPYWELGFTISDDNQFAVFSSGYENSKINVVYLETGQVCSYNVPGCESGTYSGIVLNGDQNSVQVAVGGGYSSGKAYIVELSFRSNSGRVITELPGMGSYVYSVCQSPDKKYLLCAGYSTAKAFRIDDWTEVWHLGSQYTAGVISRACFTDDMKYIICSFSASQSYGAIIRMFPFK